jgi:hypothetical protein
MWLDAADAANDAVASPGEVWMSKETGALK